MKICQVYVYQKTLSMSLFFQQNWIDFISNSFNHIYFNVQVTYQVQLCNSIANHRLVISIVQFKLECCDLTWRHNCRVITSITYIPFKFAQTKLMAHSSQIYAMTQRWCLTLNNTIMLLKNRILTDNTRHVFIERWKKEKKKKKANHNTSRQICQHSLSKLLVWVAQFQIIIS